MTNFFKQLLQDTKQVFCASEEDISEKPKEGESTYFDPDEIEIIIKESKAKRALLFKEGYQIPEGYYFRVSNNENNQQIVHQCPRLKPIQDGDMPFNMVCKIFHRINGQIERESTGFFINEKVIITVAHELYRNKLLPDDLIVVPYVKVENGEFKYPLGGIITNSFCISKGYKNSDGHKDDYAGIFLTRNHFRNLVDSFFAVRDMNEESSRSVYIAGYPDSVNVGDMSVPHLKYAETIARINESDIVHSHNPQGGQSGMPIWIEKNQKYYVIGISDSDCNSPQTKITNHVINDFRTWINNSNN